MTDLERIASELCINDGFYPSAKVFPGPLSQGVGGRFHAPDPDWIHAAVPQWTFYADYVRATLSMVLEAAGGDDLREVIDGILREKPTENDEEYIEIDTPHPPPPEKPDWRIAYGLK